MLNKFSVFLLIFYVSMYVCVVHCLDGMLGPADFVFHRFEECPEKRTGMGLELWATKVNRTTWSFSLNLTSSRDIDEDIGLIMIGSRMADGGYKPGAWFLNETNVCEIMKRILGDVFEDMKRKANIEDCPFPAGNYLITDYIWDNEKFITPRMFDDYKMEIMITYKYKPIACILMFYKFVPKKGF